MYLNQLQTMSKAFSEICQGERPWTALGNFMNYWYEYARDLREVLIADPLSPYDEHNIEQHRWAVFCAASVEWFCNKYHVPCPSWVHSPQYAFLDEPWFFYPGEKTQLVETTPEEFTRRNIFCGDRCYANKWELVEDIQQRIAEGSIQPYIPPQGIKSWSG
jgi:hypothetical protein